MGRKLRTWATEDHERTRVAAPLKVIGPAIGIPRRRTCRSPSESHHVGNINYAATVVLAACAADNSAPVHYDASARQIEGDVNSLLDQQHRKHVTTDKISHGRDQLLYDHGR